MVCEGSKRFYSKYFKMEVIVVIGIFYSGRTVKVQCYGVLFSNEEEGSVEKGMDFVEYMEGSKF